MTNKTKEQQLTDEIKRLENKPYLDLTLICVKLNLSKKDTKLIENTFNLECLDNRLQGRQEARKETIEEIEKIINNWDLREGLNKEMILEDLNKLKQKLKCQE